jgi:glycosyltransferase involved in cell wall biosynthesis
MKLILLATAWGSRHGGINAFNREFALGLAKRGGKQTEIFCYVPNATAADIADAASGSVTLASLGKRDGSDFDDSWALEICNSIAAPDMVWVGHDVITGQAALRGAAHSNSRSAIIMHMSYLDYEGQKGGPLNHSPVEKTVVQRKIFESADHIFGVGPLLTGRCREMVRRSNVIQINPGFSDFSLEDQSADVDELYDESYSLRLLLAGRLSDSIGDIKNTSLGIAAFAQAYAGFELMSSPASLEKPMLALLGVNGQKSQIQSKIRAITAKYTERTLNIVPLPFTDDRNKIANVMHLCNAALMPSWHEGFGLVGWEAISANIPLILSTSSGLYELLKSNLADDEIRFVNAVEIANPGGAKNKNDVKSLAKAITNIAKDLPEAKRRAQKLKKIIEARISPTWEKAGQTMLEALADRRNSGPSPRSSVPSEAAFEPQEPLQAGPLFPGSADEAFRIEDDNSIPACVSLAGGTTQGSERTSFHLLPELRFGQYDTSIEGVEVTFGVRQALLTVDCTDCKIAPGKRLGDEIMPNLRVDGNLWRITGPQENGLLARRALGTSPIAQVLADPTQTPSVQLSVKVRQGWIEHQIHGQLPRRLSREKKAVLDLFLNKALGTKNGEVTLSTSTIYTGEK